MDSIPNAVKLSEDTYQLPNESRSEFSVLNKLDSNAESLNVKSYGIGATTLEEVFLKVGEGTADNNPDEELDEGDIDDDYTIVDECATGLSLIFL